MKTLLKISLACNVAFLAAATFAGFRALHNRTPGAGTPAVAANIPAPAQEIQKTTEIALSRPAPAPFRWSQLESQDYHTYVRNLRAVGCPETTVRAIVTADVRAACQGRVHELEEKLADLNNGTWQTQLSHYQDEAELKAELERVPDEEAAEVADLLGLKPAAASAPVAVNSGPIRRAQPISAPLVFQDVDATALNLTEDQKQAMDNIRQSFLEDIGGTNQDPADPAYQARWQQAQPAADTQLKAMLGANSYLKYQTLAYQKSLETQAASP